MTDLAPEQDLPPTAHVTMTFLGPVAPHWEMKTHYGDEKLVEDFWTRVTARLLLLPKHDPQFRRNRERVNRDAERERIICSWDLGEDDDETSITEPQMPVEAPVVAEEAEETVDTAGDAPEVTEAEDAVEVVQTETAEVDADEVVEEGSDSTPSE